MISPPNLSQGDTIALIATARKVSPEEMAPVISRIEKEGYNVVCGKNLFGAYNQFSGSDEERAEDLQWAINNKEIKAIIVARGGYGSMRITERVDFSPLKLQPKWICGYSDVTVLHQHVHRHVDLVTLHSTMPINFAKNEEATNTLFKALRGEIRGYSFSGHSLNRTGEAEGVLVGGNLSLVYALLGTKSDLDTKEKILFLEDLDEYLYHIDRMMMSLRQSGKLENLKGMVIGGLTEMKDNAIPFGKNAEEIILDAVKDFEFPVCFDFPAGHVDRNLAFYLGRKIHLKSGSATSEIQY